MYFARGLFAVQLRFFAESFCAPLFSCNGAALWAPPGAAMTCLWLLLALLGGAQAFRLRMSANTKGVQVRFKNFAVGEADKVVQCNGGDILMDVGDAVGVKIPRGCKTGVCGTCTLDLLDPNFEGFLQKAAIFRQKCTI
eukprot:scaffold5812_cov232-Pinguiococcus_pyrenoidosus.AAC.5